MNGLNSEPHFGSFWDANLDHHKTKKKKKKTKFYTLEAISFDLRLVWLWFIVLQIELYKQCIFNTLDDSTGCVENFLRLAKDWISASKKEFLELFTRIFWLFKSLKNTIFVLLKRYLLIYVLYMTVNFLLRISLCST